MPSRIKIAQQRLVMCRMIIDIFRAAGPGYLAPGQHFGSAADDILLTCAIFIGQVERRPMPASKLAAYCGIARPTTIRKLAAMARAGDVIRLDDGAYVLPIHRVNAPETLDATERISRQILVAAALLSKMDSAHVAANREPRQIESCAVSGGAQPDGG